MRKAKRAKWGGLLAVLLLALALMSIKHRQWMLAPNDYIFGESPDGFKNYLTAAYHIERDGQVTHYEGMNYPFGEHVLFTDNQPILSTFFQFVHQHLLDLTGKSVGIFNTIQLFSWLAGAGVLFLFLFRLRLPSWYSVMAALGILFLSPQYNRFDGHFGLSHTWIFPLLLWMLLRYEERGTRWKEVWPIALLTWVGAQFHFYFFGLSALFLGCYTLVVLANGFSIRQLIKRATHLGVMVVLPFLLLTVWLRASDFAADRPSYPYGFTTYIGYWEGIFLPYESFPLYQWIDQNVIRIRRVDWETQAYAGMLVFFFFLWALGRGFRLFSKKEEPPSDHIIQVQRQFMQRSVVAAVLLTLFACGFPYAIKGMQWMVDYMGPLRQFRGLARFTWSFYYLMNLAAVYLVWQKAQVIKSSWKRWALLLTPLLLLGYDAFTYQKGKKMHLSPNVASREMAAADPEHWLNKVDFSAYQALLPLPYYHVGSENIWLDPHFGLFRKVQTTALHTGLSDMGVVMSRTPLHQTLLSVQLVKEPCQIPRMLEFLPNSKPIALLVEASEWENVRYNYPHLVKKAQEVYSSAELRILALPLDSLRAAAKEAVHSVQMDREQQVLTTVGIWERSGAEKGFLHQTFDSLASAPHRFRGAGALEGVMKDTTWLFKGTLTKDYYYLNLWLYAKEDMALTHELKVIQNSLVDGREINVKHEGLRFHLKTLVNDWALFDVPFEVYENGAETKIFLQKKGVDRPFFVDEMLIKPSDITLYRQEEGWISRNNFWFQL